MEDSPKPGEMDRASIARDVNRHIRELARRFRDDRDVGFLCECGCMRIVLATLAEYDEQGSVRIEAHPRPGDSTG